MNSTSTYHGLASYDTSWDRFTFDDFAMGSFTDNFNRANSSSSVGGTGWTVRMRKSSFVTSAWGISSNRAYCASTPTSGGTLSASLLLHDNGPGDFDMTFTLPTYTSGPFTAPVAAFRANLAADDGNNGLSYFVVTRTQIIQMDSNTGGSSTWGSYSLVAGDVIRIRSF